VHSLNYKPTALGGYKVEVELHLGVLEQESLNTTGLKNPGFSSLDLGTLIFI
jgi:hypothetical protein